MHYNYQKNSCFIVLLTFEYPLQQIIAFSKKKCVSFAKLKIKLSPLTLGVSLET